MLFGATVRGASAGGLLQRLCQAASLWLAAPAPVNADRFDGFKARAASRMSRGGWRHVLMSLSPTARMRSTDRACSARRSQAETPCAADRGLGSVRAGFTCRTSRMTHRRSSMCILRRARRRTLPVDPGQSTAFGDWQEVLGDDTAWPASGLRGSESSRADRLARRRRSTPRPGMYSLWCSSWDFGPCGRWVSKMPARYPRGTTT